MIDFILNMIPSLGTALWAISAAIAAVLFGLIRGGAKKKEGIAIGTLKAENAAIKKDIINATKIEDIADAARANDHGGLSATDRIAATGRLRKPKNHLP